MIRRGLLTYRDPFIVVSWRDQTPAAVATGSFVFPLEGHEIIHYLSDCVLAIENSDPQRTEHRHNGDRARTADPGSSKVRCGTSITTFHRAWSQTFRMTVSTMG